MIFVKFIKKTTVSDDSDQDARIAWLKDKIAEYEGILAGRQLAFARTYAA